MKLPSPRQSAALLPVALLVGPTAFLADRPLTRRHGALRANLALTAYGLVLHFAVRHLVRR